MRGIYLAEGAMLTQQQRMEMVGNNLINQRTPGFKRDHGVQSSFAEWMMLARGVNQGMSRTGNHHGQRIGPMAHNVAIAESYTIMSDGNLNQTFRNLDLALAGNAFFQVMSDDGLFYTRNGRFFLDEGGYLVNEHGHQVMGEAGPIYLGTENFTVLEDGSIYVENRFIDRLALVPFDPNENYTKVGDNYFAPVDMMGIDFTVKVFQGYLEGSNVDLAKEMTAMMEIRRSFEAAQKVMLTQDAVMKLAANDLASLR